MGACRLPANVLPRNVLAVSRYPCAWQRRVLLQGPEYEKSATFQPDYFLKYRRTFLDVAAKVKSRREISGRVCTHTAAA